MVETPKDTFEIKVRMALLRN